MRCGPLVIVPSGLRSLSQHELGAGFRDGYPICPHRVEWQRTGLWEGRMVGPGRPWGAVPWSRVAPESRLGGRFENTLRMSLILGGVARSYPQHPVGVGVLG